MGKQRWLCGGKTWVKRCLIMFDLRKESTHQECSHVPQFAYCIELKDLSTFPENGPQIPPLRFRSCHTWFLT